VVGEGHGINKPGWSMRNRQASGTGQLPAGLHLLEPQLSGATQLLVHWTSDCEICSLRFAVLVLLSQCSVNEVRQG